MHNGSDSFHFPADIFLAHNPLVEAWLEVHWLAKPRSSDRGVATHGRSAETEVDPFFQLAVGANMGRSSRSMHTSSSCLLMTPPGQLPHVVRLRFRPAANEWPVMQFGPGIATINFTQRYSWTTFRQDSLRLREILLTAYGDAVLEPIACSLRYRNAVHFNYAEQDIFEFLRQQLNLSLVLSPYIPGTVGVPSWPNDINVNLRFSLTRPTGVGVMRVQTGIDLSEANSAGASGGKPIILLDYEVQSRGSEAPMLGMSRRFSCGSRQLIR